MKLDKFYTNHDIAAACYKLVNESVDTNDQTRFIEPSAGSGDFLAQVDRRRTRAIDIMPTAPGIEKADFLTWNGPPRCWRRQHTIIIGNPPFGKRGDMAVRFFNRACSFGDTIGFIVPVIFRKHFIHKQLNAGYKLIAQMNIPRNSYHLPNGKPYAINTDFQVWTGNQTQLPDIRHYTPPPTTHQDFTIYQYNNTEAALKVFDNEFDFAVPCQGYQDYSRREKDAEKCERNKQWMLFQSTSKPVYNRLFKFDYHKLAMTVATMTPGFRKGDVFTAYGEWHG